MKLLAFAALAVASRMPGLLVFVAVQGNLKRCGMGMEFVVRESRCLLPGVNGSVPAAPPVSSAEPPPGERGGA